jgi:large subunit ribosomal protein L9
LRGAPSARNTGSPTTLRRVMEVILKEDVDTLGHRGDVVKVADGYGRNFLLPKKLAIEATAANRNVIEQMKQSALRRSAKEKTDAQQLVAQMEQVELTFTRKVGENDHLFGSVTSSDIAHALEQKGYSVDRRKVQLDEPLKQLGEFHIPVKLHREVSAHIKVTVSAEAGSEA